MIGSGWRPLPLLALTVAMLSLAAGCGHDDGDDGRATVAPSPADEPPTVFVRRLLRLIETTETGRQCGQLNSISFRSLTRFSCPPDARLRKSLAGFEMGDAAAYGTGGVVDYKSQTTKTGAAIVLFVDPSLRWAVSQFGVVAEPSVGTSDEQSRRGFDSTVASYLAAVRRRDCEAYERSAGTQATGKEVCEVEFASTKSLAQRLKRNPAAKPRYLGGNGSFGFYSLETRKPKPANITIVVGRVLTKSGPTTLVLAVAPAPTAAQQRVVPKKQAPPEPSQSRKA